MRYLTVIFAAFAGVRLASGEPAIKSGNDDRVLWMQNTRLRVECDRDTAHVRIKDRRDDSVIIDGFTWWTSSPVAATVQADISPYAGMSMSGKQLRLERTRPDGLEEVLSVRLGNTNTFLEFGLKVINKGTNDTHIKEFGIRGIGFPGRIFPDYKTLDGESDGYATHVAGDDRRAGNNNLLATFGLPSRAKHSLVIGGLHYQEFKRYCTITNTASGLAFEVKAEDPCGKLIKAGKSWDFPDTIYIDALTENRFEALETYGRALAQANKIDLAVPDVPIINMWYPQEKRFGNSFWTNNTPGTMWVINDAKKTDFLKYGAVGVRIEPDDYSTPDNEQGWWNDEHFQRFHSGQFLPPYETVAKWGAAMKEAGGIPFIYFQTARRSEDFCRKFPRQMLFNDPAKERPTPIEWFKDKYWSYDFTNPEFIQHMRAVYDNLRQAGVRGVKFDYPTTGWDYMGGFEDPLATTGSAYRNIFQLALDGLGPGSDVQERLGAAGDLTLGTVTTMRIQEDTDRLYPPMVTKTGLRWYKNRVAILYDLDVKNPNHAAPSGSIDGVRAMFTMMTVVSGRLELGKYMGEISPENRQVLSRVVPLYLSPKSARPIDAFGGNQYPQVYDLEVQPDWHQVTFYNSSIEGGSWPDEWRVLNRPLQGHPVSTTVSVALGCATDDGGLGLDADKNYHVFDFWNDHYIGSFRGSDSLTQQLRPGESRMMSIHEALHRPQFLSTDRHILQGVVDLARCEWRPQERKLVGTSRLVADEPYTIIIALNGYKPKKASAKAAEASLHPRPESPDLQALRLLSRTGGMVDWQVTYK